MAKEYIRKAQVIVNERTFNYPDFEMQFDISFDADDDPNNCRLRIYNLSQDSKRLFKIATPIIINAGYGDDIGTIFAGQITGVTGITNGPDKGIQVEIQDAQDAFYDQFISKSYAAGSTSKSIIDDLIAITGLTPGAINITNDITYKKGYSAYGPFINVLKDLVNDTGQQLLIKNQTINIVEAGQGFETGYVLGADNGLLEVNLIDDPKKQAQYEVTSILNHNINTKSIVEIRSSEFNGLALVASGKHTSDWNTVIEVITI